jgi:hypothetical protein
VQAAMAWQARHRAEQAFIRSVPTFACRRASWDDVCSCALAGIAIIAHLFAVPFLSPQQIAAQPSPFDDPFASSSTIATGADMCLGLEMLRHGDLRILGSVSVGKGAGMVEVETPTDVRVYVDQRCPETMDWFEKSFCTAAGVGKGVRIAAGGASGGSSPLMTRSPLTKIGEEVIIFGSYPELSAPSASTRPSMTLLLGREVKVKPRRPRPDDPAPRGRSFPFLYGR